MRISNLSCSFHSRRLPPQLAKSDTSLERLDADRVTPSLMLTERLLAALLATDSPLDRLVVDEAGASAELRLEDIEMEREERDPATLELRTDPLSLKKDDFERLLFKNEDCQRKSFVSGAPACTHV